MARRFKATIDIYIEVGERWESDTEGALADGISAIMQNAAETTAASGDEFTLVDWSYLPDDTGSFAASYAKPFDGLTPEEELAHRG